MNPKKAEELASRLAKGGKGISAGAALLGVGAAAVYAIAKSMFTGKNGMSNRNNLSTKGQI